MEAPRVTRDFTRRERRLISQLRTPRAVQAWLRELPYNWEATFRTFRGVVQHERAHCAEAMLFACAVMSAHGYPPLVLDLESQDGLDHVLFLYRERGRWGTVARSRDEGLHGRKPVFRTLPALVRSYMDPYVDGEGRLVGYGVTNLDTLVRRDWRLATHSVWVVERALIAMPHFPIHMPDARYERALRRFRGFKAAHPTPTASDWRRHLTPQDRFWL
ncbi:MAG: hypothetical protein JNL26_01980 [Gemmatimonadetes bacterium]|nr:hypothetical protein [Gemmatimonadota bacterium]